MGARDSAPTRDVDCGDCPAAKRCWGDPPPSGAGVVVTRRVALDRGATLFQQGDAFGGLYVVAAGCLKLRETMADGAERIVALRTPGEVVGLEGWSSGRHPHAAIAATDAQLCRLRMPPRGGGSSTELLERVLGKAAVQLERASRPWAGRSALSRVQSFVEDLAERLGEDAAGCGDFRLPLTRSEIGSHLGLAEETVVRALTKLSGPARLEQAREAGTGRARTAGGRTAIAGDSNGYRKDLRLAYSSR